MTPLDKVVNFVAALAVLTKRRNPRSMGRRVVVGREIEKTLANERRANWVVYMQDQLATNWSWSTFGDSCRDAKWQRSFYWHCLCATVCLFWFGIFSSAGYGCLRGMVVSGCFDE